MIGIIVFFSANLFGQTSEDWVKMGVKKANLEDYRGAIADFNKAIEIDPKDGDAYNNRGKAKFDLEDYRGAKVRKFFTVGTPILEYTWEKNEGLVATEGTMEKRTATVFSLFGVHEETNTSTKASSSWISIDVGSALGFGMSGEFSISLPILELGTYIKKK